MTDPSDWVCVDVIDRVQRVRLHRPEKKNALTRDMYAAMATALQDADRRDDVRVTLLCGTDHCFTAGNDLQDFLVQPPTDASSPVVQFLTAIATADTPVMAAVQGAAVGVGTTMLLHCDLVYAGRSAMFQLPFVNLGLCPEAASSYLLPLRVGSACAAEWLLLGEPITAEQALSRGLINAVVDDAELESFGMSKARQLASQPPAAVREAKRLLRQPHAQTVRQVMRDEIDVFVRRVKSPEAKETMQAFLEKRPPDFSSFS